MDRVEAPSTTSVGRQTISATDQALITSIGVAALSTFALCTDGVRGVLTLNFFIVAAGFFRYGDRLNDFIFERPVDRGSVALTASPQPVPQTAASASADGSEDGEGSSTGSDEHADSGSVPPSASPLPPVGQTAASASADGSEDGESSSPAEIDRGPIFQVVESLGLPRANTAIWDKPVEGITEADFGDHQYLLGSDGIARLSSEKIIRVRVYTVLGELRVDGDLSALQWTGES